MFTGIVSALGEVKAVARGNGSMRLTIESPGEAPAIGASICHNGCCLTVVEANSVHGAIRFDVEVAAESMEKTTLGALREGDKVNLERALRAGDELGGHIVTGHVDGLGLVLSVSPDGEAWRMKIAPPADIAPLIASKGSVAVDGVSLTVNEVDAQGFGVLVIPHTWAVTTLSKLKAGDRVNLEADLMARYVARILSAKA